MAGIYINSRFKPLSYSEIVAPLAQQTEVQNQYEDAYAELDTKASVWEGMADKTRDRQAYQQYKKYADDLHAAADILLKNGLNPSSRAAVANLRARYTSEITPIEQAYQTRKEQMKMQQEAMMKDPTHLFAQQASNVSLDQYLNNQQYDALSQNYSGNLLTQQVANQAQALAKELSGYGTGKRLDAYHKTFLQQHGFTKQQVLDAINNPNAAQSQPVLNSIVEAAVNGSGIKGWNNNEALQQAYNYAKQGLWQAVGQTQVSPFEDYGAKLAAQKRMQQDLMTQQSAVKMQDPNGTSLFTKDDVAKKNEKTISDYNKYRKLGYINAEGKVTNKGWKALTQTPQQQKSSDRNSMLFQAFGKPLGNASTAATTTTPNSINVIKSDQGFGDFLSTFGLQKGKLSVKGINQAFTDMNNRIKNGDFATGAMNVPVYRNAVNETQSKSLADMVSANLGSKGKIYKLDTVTPGNKNSNYSVTLKGTEPLTGKEFRELVNPSDSKKDAQRIVYMSNVPSANGVLVQLSDGSQYILPEGVLSQAARDQISKNNAAAVAEDRAGNSFGALLNINAAQGYATQPFYPTKAEGVDRNGNIITVGY